MASLARDHFEVIGEPASYPEGAALGPIDGRVIVLQSGVAARTLGRAMLYAQRRSADTVDLLVDEDAGVLARRAAVLAGAPRVWQVEGRDLIDAVPAPPAVVHEEVPEHATPFLPLFATLGLDVVVEDGVARVEVLGLEVARVEAPPGEDPGLAVGVGRFDREATAMLHADRPPADALARATALVREHRHPEAQPHPLNRLARSRWLRTIVLAEPASVGASTLAPVSPPVPNTNLTEATPAAAWGVGGDGASVLVVCSVGVDLDLVPTAADLLVSQPSDRVVLVTPARDAIDPVRRLADRLPVPVSFVAVGGPWRD